MTGKHDAPFVIANESMQDTAPSPSRAEGSGGTTPHTIIEVDGNDERHTTPALVPLRWPTNGDLFAGPCKGLALEIPTGSNPALVYPFGLHAMKVILWNIHIGNSELRLTAHNCSGVT